MSPIKIKRGMSVSALAKQMEAVKVLGPGRFGKAVKILSQMFSDQQCCKMLSIAGPIVPGGLRTVLVDLVEKNLINAIVTTGANVTHDMLEGLGHRHIVGSETDNDVSLRKRGLSRIYDLLVKQKAIEHLERSTRQMLDRIPLEERRNIATFELLWHFGSQLKDKRSLLSVSSEKRTPIFCPGIFDSMLGLDLWTYSQLNPLFINPFKDFSRLVNMSYESKRVGAIVLGGGMPKHHVLIANSYRGGVDAAIQLTLDRPEGGGASGAPLEEAISWGKIKSRDSLVTLVGDALVLFPIITLAALENSRR
ncbi:MAG TPA: deoxyhypusine synthase family protein [Methylomirabilota bacterium]|nr:deoxyhypusine synthase family protein [Methylomirabilota bacterium]